MVDLKKTATEEAKAKGNLEEEQEDAGSSMLLLPVQLPDAIFITLRLKFQLM